MRFHRFPPFRLIKANHCVEVTAAGGISPAAVHKLLCKFPVPRFLPDIPEFLIDSFLLYQFNVNAFFYNFSVIHHQNLIGIPNRGQPVCNDNQRLIFYQSADGLLQMHLVFRVNAGGCLVKQDNRRVLEHGAGDGDPLLFSTGQGGAAFANYRVISLWQSRDKIVAAGFFRGLHNLFMCCFRESELDIILDGIANR